MAIATKTGNTKNNALVKPLQVITPLSGSIFQSDFPFDSPPPDGDGDGIIPPIGGGGISTFFGNLGGIGGNNLLDLLPPEFQDYLRNYFRRRY